MKKVFLAILGFCFLSSLPARARIAPANMVMVEGSFYYTSSGSKTTYNTSPDQETPLEPPAPTLDPRY